MLPKVLHVLSQRPSRTGSGITLDAVVRLAEHAGWEQAAAVGVPVNDEAVAVGLLTTEAIHPLRFQGDEGHAAGADLNFPIPGMSDVMPYPSTVFSTLNTEKLATYRRVWHEHLEKIIQKFQPEIIHSHHIWLVSSLLKDVAPHVPVLTTCHATGLRQMKLCPHLAAEVITGCRRNDHFFVLRNDQRSQLAQILGISEQKITVAGAGFRSEIFHPNHSPSRKDLLYVGKFSHAKGLPWLLDAFENLQFKQPDLRLHIAGGGSGAEAEDLRTRMNSMAPAVIMHGMLDQENLAHLMRQCRICVLPSFYEGVPLVLVEAAACGCLLVSTRLPGVVEQIAPVLGDALKMIPLPRLQNIDQPVAGDLPLFTENLEAAISTCLNTAAAPIPDLDSLSWSRVYQRVETVWKQFTS